MLGSKTPLKFACADNLGADYTGKLDEIRFYDRALGAEELESDLATALQSPPSQDPIAAYSLDEGQGKDANDLFGAGTALPRLAVMDRHRIGLVFDHDAPMRAEIALESSGSLARGGRRGGGDEQAGQGEECNQDPLHAPILSNPVGDDNPPLD